MVPDQNNVSPCSVSESYQWFQIKTMYPLVLFQSVTSGSRSKVP